MSIRRILLRAKIHRATVTQADLTYEGSITIPPDLLEAGDFVEFEKVAVWNVTAGTRFETYVILGEKDSRSICVNGAAARLVSPGDKVIIAAFAEVDEEQVRNWKPKVLFVDDENQIKEMRAEIAGPRKAPLLV